MTVTLAIGNKLEVPVKFTLKDGKLNKNYAFTLSALRKTSEEITQAFNANEFKFKETLESLDVIEDWQGQNLVLGEDGKPAPFSAEAFAAMLGVMGVASVVYSCYQKECGAKEKN